MLEQIFMLQPMKDPMLQQVDMPCRKLQPQGSAQCSRFSGRNSGPWKTYTGAVCFWRTVPHGKDPRWSSFWRTVFSGIQVGAVCAELYPMGETSWWSRGRMWGGRSSTELTTTPILLISCIARSRKERRIRSDIKPVKNRVKSCVKVFSVLILFLSFLLSY